MNLTAEQKLKMYEWKISCFEGDNEFFIDSIYNFEKDLMNDEMLCDIFYNKLEYYFKDDKTVDGIVLALKYILLPILKEKTIITLAGLILNDLNFREEHIDKVAEIYNSLI